MTNTVKVCLIAARGRNGVIGADGDLPWRLKDDLAFFKSRTLGKPIIMGRRTWESLPRRPLPGRPNIVLSRDWNYHAPGARLYTHMTLALSVARSMAARSGEDEVFIIGGATLYEAALDACDRLYLSEVDASPKGDVRFPEVDEGVWQETWRRDHAAGDGNDHAFSIRRLDRVVQP